MRRKAITDPTTIIIVLLIAGAGLFLIVNNLIDSPLQEGGTSPASEGGIGSWFRLPDLNINIEIPWSQPDTPSDDQPPPSDPTPPIIPDNFKKPTSLTIVLSPNPMNMKGMIYGQCISNGYNYNVELYARHKGSGETVHISGWLGEDGKFTHTQQINTAGYWEFWAETDSGAVTSNIAPLTVRGILVVTDGHVSLSLDPIKIIRVYSSYTGNCLIVAHDHEVGASIPMTNTVVNSGGYGDVSFDYSGWTRKTYEIDAIIGGTSAQAWGGSAWTTVGR